MISMKRKWMGKDMEEDCKFMINGPSCQSAPDTCRLSELSHKVCLIDSVVVLKAKLRPYLNERADVKNPCLH